MYLSCVVAAVLCCTCVEPVLRVKESAPFCMIVLATRKHFDHLLLWLKKSRCVETLDAKAKTYPPK